MHILKTLFFASVLFFGNGAFAYLSVGESGEIPARGYLFGVEPQFLVNEGGGANAGVFLDAPWRDDLSSRFSLGVGKIDFHLGVSLKYIPIPDVDRQPAIGLKVAAWYARQGSLNVWTIQVAPLFSKKFAADFGIFIPYVAVPVNFVSATDNSHTGTQFVVGSELYAKDVDKMHFSAELGLNLKDSYSFVSGTVVFPLDSEKGFLPRGR